jgi:ABC-type branched-subunit amino acid transport system substrate-binding protein
VLKTTATVLKTTATVTTTAELVATVSTKDKIVFGQAVSLSGPLASGNAAASSPYYDLWVKDVNAAGGIYVKEYGKKLPVELIIYDDKSDVGTMTKLLEKLIVEDKVDFILPPWGTGMLFAAATIAQKYNYILVGGAWNEKSSAGAKAFAEHYKAVIGKDIGNFWGSLYFYSAMQHFQQAIEEAGTLDQSVIRDLLATMTYETALGSFWYDSRRIFLNHPGKIGQW